MMMDAKKQALMDMKKMLKGGRAEKMKVMVAGNNPAAVKEGLEKAEDVVEEIPGQMPKPEAPKADMKMQAMLAGLSPEEKMSLHKLLMVEMGGEEEKEDGEDEMSC